MIGQFQPTQIGLQKLIACVPNYSIDDLEQGASRRCHRYLMGYARVSSRGCTSHLRKDGLYCNCLHWASATHFSVAGVDEQLASTGITSGPDLPDSCVVWIEFRECQG